MALARLTEVIRCARLDGRKQARDEIATLTSHADAQKEMLAERGARIIRLRDQLAAKDARIAELDTMLAQRPALLTTDCEHSLDDCQHGTDVFWDSITREKEGSKERASKAPPEHNPFQSFPEDRRRIGG